MPTLAAAVWPDGERAVVTLGQDTEPPYPYQVHCHREDRRWVEGSGSNGAGWTRIGDATGATTLWGEAPPGSRAAVIAFRGVEHNAPVSNGFYLFARVGCPG